MTDILALLQCIAPLTSKTTLCQLSRVILGMLVMTGRVTMLGISRWAGKGGSYRTVQRFFYTAMPWALLFWQFFRQHLHRPEDTYLLAGDEVVVTKAGKRTFGLDRFFSSLHGRPVPGLSFFTLSLVSIRERKSFPVQIGQIVRSEAEKAASKARAVARKTKSPGIMRPRGRPKGSKTKNRAGLTLTAELLRIKGMIETLLNTIDGLVPLVYMVLDGHFGNHYALHMVRQCNLHMISKLRSDSALYLPYEGPYEGRGPHRKYGSRLKYRNIPDKYLKEKSVKDHIQTCVYQARLLHKEFPQPLNTVIIVKTNLQTLAWAHVVLLSSDLQLSYDKMIDYYSLRFQIEFNFRDAKQYWGLEDFMNVSETAVTNAANLPLFMVNVSHCLLRELRQSDPESSILDLKAHYRGYKYVDETIKMLPQKPDPFLLKKIFNKVASLGRIHTIQHCFSPP